MTARDIIGLVVVFGLSGVLLVLVVLAAVFPR